MIIAAGLAGGRGTPAPEWLYNAGYFDAAATDSGATISGNGLIVSGVNSGYSRITGLITQKALVHVLFKAGTQGTLGIAVAAADPNTAPNGSTGAYTYYSGDGAIYYNGGNTAYGNTYAVGDTITIAFDPAALKMWVAKNFTWQNSGDPDAGTNGFTVAAGNYYFIAGDIAGAAQTYHLMGKQIGYN